MTGAARTWLEGVLAGTVIDEVLAKFRQRFGAGDACRPEFMAEFWERRQEPDEPTGRYLEEKARLARRARIGNEPFVLQGMMQGLRAEIRRDVLVQRPTTTEELRKAADVADVSTKATRHQTDDAAMNAQMADMRSMMATMQAMMAANYPERTPATTAHNAGNHAATAGTAT